MAEPIVKKSAISLAVLALITSASLLVDKFIFKPNPRLVWDQNSISLDEANKNIYKYYLDGAANAITFTDVKCEVTSTPKEFTCSTPQPVLPNGPHVIELVTIFPNCVPDPKIPNSCESERAVMKFSIGSVH